MYLKKLHATYNSIQYIMSKQNNLDSFKPYEELFKQKMIQLQKQYEQQFKNKSNDLSILQLQNQINGQEILFNSKDIAEAATQKLKDFKIQDKDSISSRIASIYTKLQQGASQGQQVYSELYDLIKARNGLLPKGSRISIEAKRLPEIKQLLLQAENFKNGNFFNTLGEVGELTSVISASAISDALLHQLEEKLNLQHGDLKVTAKVIHTGQKKINNIQVQTDNQLQLVFQLNNQNLIGQIDMPAGGLKMTVNLSDKAKKNLATIDSKRRSSTNTLSFRSTTMKQFFEDVELKTQSAMYNLISFHRQGKELVNFMYTNPGIALRQYIGYKMAIAMFLDEEKLNQVNFTVYGNKIFAEDSVLLKLQAKKFTADIEYWSLRDLVGKFKEGKTVEERLQAGTAEANRRIRNLKVALRTSLKF